MPMKVPGFSKEEESDKGLEIKQEQSVKYKRPSDDVGFHQFAPPKDLPDVFEKRFIKSTIEGMNEVLEGKGYPPGSVISFVSVPKLGKTTMAIHEAINMAVRGDDVLYIYNESIQREFMRIVDKHRQDLGISRDAISNWHLTFLDRHSKSPESANYGSIEKFVQSFLLNPMKGWLEKHDNPKLIVIDSLTKFIRKYPAQAFVFVEKLMYGIKEMMDDLNKYPVVFAINQKSSTFDKRDDESVLGGLGIVHDMDGSFVIRGEIVDKWLADETGLQRGSLLRIFRVQEIRLANADSRERIFSRLPTGDGHIKLSIGETLDETVKKGPHLYGKKKEDTSTSKEQAAVPG